MGGKDTGTGNGKGYGGQKLNNGWMTGNKDESINAPY
jgi:hypothetical protein